MGRGVRNRRTEIVVEMRGDKGKRSGGRGLSGG